jgi:oligoendopeptidase F
MKLERLYLYSMLAKDSDMRNTKYQGMDDRIKTIYSKVLQQVHLSSLNYLKLMKKKFGQINSNPDLKIYKQSFDDLFKI